VSNAHPSLGLEYTPLSKSVELWSDPVGAPCKVLRRTGSQARGFFLHGISAPPPYLGQDYEKNEYSEKHGMVKLNRLSDHQMGESYGARVVKAEIGRSFQKERESAGVKRTRMQRVRKTA